MIIEKTVKPTNILYVFEFLEMGEEKALLLEA